MSKADTAKAAAIGVGGVAVVGGIGWLIWEARNGIKALFEGVGDLGKGIGDLAAGAGDLVAGVGQGVGAVGNVTGGLFTGGNGANLVAPGPNDFQDNRSELVLTTFNKSDKNTSLNKRTTVSLRVTDKTTGKPVPYATITATPNNAVARVALTGSLTGKITRITDASGQIYGFFWEVRNLPSTDGEDDMTFVASKTGYNPSRPVTVL